jgi:hypothetical protein
MLPRLVPAIRLPTNSSLLDSKSVISIASADMARERKLLAEAPQPFAILTFVRIDLTVGAIEIGGSQDSGGAMARP